MFTFFNEKFTQLNNPAKSGVKIQRILFNRVKNIGSFLCSKRFKNPLFYFGFFSLVLLGLLFSGSDSLARLSYFKEGEVLSFNSFFENENSDAGDLFFDQSNIMVRETPDLKIIEYNFVYGISTPRVLTTQTLGAIMGGSEQVQERKDVTDYIVQPGDTIESIAQSFNVSVNTLLWANSLSKNSTLKTGQKLVILPVSGLLHIVKSGDTISDLGKIYKSKTEDIVALNGLSGEGDIFIGDILIVPGGFMPQKLIPSIGIGITPLADSFFIFPAEGQISQGLHYYNGVDVANKCGTPIYAAAAGTVQRTASNGKWNLGMGNHITVLHSGGIVTYYGHLTTLFVKPGDQVNVGDRIGLMGRTGKATGCHVHFQVMGAKNPLAKYLIGSLLKYK